MPYCPQCGCQQYCFQIFPQYCPSNALPLSSSTAKHSSQYCLITVPSTAQVSSVLSQYHPTVISIPPVPPKCPLPQYYLSITPLSSALGQARSRLSCPGRLRPPLRPAASPGWPATGGLVAVLRPRLAVSVQDNNNNSVTMHHVSCCLHPAPGTYPGHLATTGYTGAGAGPGPAWENSTLPQTGQIWNTDNLVVEEIDI